MRCTQLLLIVDYEVITVIIITVLIKYPVLSSKTLSTISLLYLEGSVRDAINLPVVFSVQITCSSCTYHWPCFGFLFFSFFFCPILQLAFDLILKFLFSCFVFSVVGTLHISTKVLFLSMYWTFTIWQTLQ